MENRVKQLRLERAWSQEQLAQLSSLSTRTIQRIENNETPSLETLGALASVFNVSVSELAAESLPESVELDNRIVEAKKRVEAEARLLKSIIVAVVVCMIMYFFNYLYMPYSNRSVWVIAIWGGVLLIKSFKLFLLNGLLLKWRKNRLTSLIRKH